MWYISETYLHQAGIEPRMRDKQQLWWNATHYQIHHISII